MLKYNLNKYLLIWFVKRRMTFCLIIGILARIEIQSGSSWHKAWSHHTGDHWGHMTTHAQSSGWKHQWFTQSTIFLLVMRVEIKPETEALETIIIAACELVEESFDHISIWLADNFELSSGTSQLTPDVNSPPLLVLNLLFLSRSISTSPSCTVNQQLSCLSCIPLKNKIHKQKYRLQSITYST